MRIYFCKESTARDIVEDLFDTIDILMQISYEWSNCMGICIDEPKCESLYFKSPSSLKLYVENYFSSVEAETFDWKRNPVDANLIAVTVTTTEEKQFIDVCSDTYLKITFQTMPLPRFWISV
jgi:hypothetical protein